MPFHRQKITLADPADTFTSPMSARDLESTALDGEAGTLDYSDGGKSDKASMHIELISEVAFNDAGDSSSSSEELSATTLDGPASSLTPRDPAVGLGLKVATAEVAIEMDGAEDGAEAEGPPPGPRPGPSAWDRAGWASRLTFGFMGGVIRTGAKRPLQLSDIDEPPDNVKAAHALHVFNEHWAVECQNPKPKLYKSL
eukprot:EG_transcript_32160